MEIWWRFVLEIRIKTFNDTKLSTNMDTPKFFPPAYSSNHICMYDNTFICRTIPAKNIILEMAPYFDFELVKIRIFLLHIKIP